MVTTTLDLARVASMQRQGPLSRYQSQICILDQRADPDVELAALGASLDQTGKGSCRHCLTLAAGGC